MIDKKRIERFIKLLLEHKEDLESRRALEEARGAKLAELEAQIAAKRAERDKLERFRGYIAGFGRDLARALGLPGTASPEWPKGGGRDDGRDPTVSSSSPLSSNIKLLTIAMISPRPSETCRLNRRNGGK
jgi:hypothetical protein